MFDTHRGCLRIHYTFSLWFLSPVFLIMPLLCISYIFDGIRIACGTSVYDVIFSNNKNQSSKKYNILILCIK